MQCIRKKRYLSNRSLINDIPSHLFHRYSKTDFPISFQFTFPISFSLIAPTIAKLVYNLPNKLTFPFVEKVHGDYLKFNKNHMKETTIYSLHDLKFQVTIYSKKFSRQQDSFIIFKMLSLETSLEQIKLFLKLKFLGIIY